MRKAKLDTKFRTFSNKKRMKKCIELADNFKEDPEKKERLLQKLCPVCFYIKDRIGGDALTSVECACCTEIINSSNTDVDVLCYSCSINYMLCKHCGCDLTEV
jgi:hypothetical protein